MVSNLEKKLNEYFKNLESCHADVGFLDGGRGYADGELNVPTVAYIQEYGVSSSKRKKKWFIPPRPFMSFSTAIFESKFSNILAKELVSNKYDSQKAIGVAGESLKQVIQKSIIEWSTPPNAPYTVEKKGFNDPLIHTGTMYDSVEYSVKSGLGNES